ncbi:hypothetical protein, partial [Mesorhizobium sp.]|uniref:hypothetical protein n=1 Tax=Mesorhizobium sp. TaxID=1871066 RepID=UPI0025E0EF7C
MEIPISQCGPLLILLAIAASLNHRELALDPRRIWHPPPSAKPCGDYSLELVVEVRIGDHHRFECFAYIALV